MPVVLGHESAGVVEAVGEDVTYVKPGDHVISCLSVFCGHCEFCLERTPLDLPDARGEDAARRRASRLTVAAAST